MAVFNYLSCADREKDKPNYCFLSFVKNNGKEGLKLSKVRREKWLAQIFRNDLTERKLERKRMKVILSASPSLVFSYKVHNIRSEKQIGTYSILMVVIELTDRQCLSPQLGSQNFMTLLILNTNFIKRESKIGYQWVLNWDSSG